MPELHILYATVDQTRAQVMQSLAKSHRPEQRVPSWKSYIDPSAVTVMESLTKYLYILLNPIVIYVL